MIEKTDAYRIEGSPTLYKTVREARLVEFQILLNKAVHALPSCQIFNALGEQLASGRYPSGSDAFIAAAEYLKQHRLVLSGAERGEPDKVNPHAVAPEMLP